MRPLLDTPEKLADALTLLHPLLKSHSDWSATIRRAIEQHSNEALEVLCYTLLADGLADECLGLVSRLRASQVHGPTQRRPCDGDTPSATRLSRGSDAARFSTPERARRSRRRVGA